MFSICRCLPAGLEANLPKGFKEQFPIRIILKNRLLPIAAIDDVINRFCVLDSKLSGMLRRVCSQRKDCQLYGLPPCGLSITPPNAY